MLAVKEIDDKGAGVYTIYTYWYSEFEFSFDLDHYQFLLS